MNSALAAVAPTMRGIRPRGGADDVMRLSFAALAGRARHGLG
jgi:hypothetical protein